MREGPVFTFGCSEKGGSSGSGKHGFFENLSDLNLVPGQAKRKNALPSLDDYYVKKPFDSTNAARSRQMIRRRFRLPSASCLIGQTTSSGKWVNWEMRRRSDLGNRVLVVESDSGKNPTPASLTELGARAELENRGDRRSLASCMLLNRVSWNWRSDDRENGAG
jgi:hypothetical protein